MIEYLKTIEEEDNNERSDEDETDEVEELARNVEDVQDLLSKFSVMKKNELIAECRSKKLTIRGNKDALAKRLFGNNKSSVFFINYIVIGYVPPQYVLTVFSQHLNNEDYGHVIYYM